jgi:formate/nitrite transporter FocA (FNT family)
VLVFDVLGALVGAAFLALSHRMNLRAEEPMTQFGVHLMQHALGTRFAHIVAGSVEVFYASWMGAVPWSSYPSFFIPTFLGNVVGGVLFVTLISFAQIVGSRPKSRNGEPHKKKPAR